jgi:hypothetical protein
MIALFGKKSLKKQNRIRMIASFGQRKPQKAKWCQNEGFIPTGKPKKIQKVSK